jgi:DNA-binding transcriptional regulator YdaS (Cro superfamily)
MFVLVAPSFVPRALPGHRRGLGQPRLAQASAERDRERIEALLLTHPKSIRGLLFITRWLFRNSQLWSIVTRNHGNNRESALDRACEAAKGSSRLAQLLTAKGRKVSKASISRWKKERVPAEACPDIEELTGIKCEDLRPDVHWGCCACQRMPSPRNPAIPGAVQVTGWWAERWGAHAVRSAHLRAATRRGCFRPCCGASQTPCRQQSASPSKKRSRMVRRPRLAPAFPMKVLRPCATTARSRVSP